MTKINEEQQRTFFDVVSHQYPDIYLKKPPFHTVLEQTEISNRLKKINKKKIVMDFGAGSGRISIWLLMKGFNVLAVDISKESLAILKKKATELQLKSLTTTERIPKEKVAAVVGADVLHHVDMEVYLPKLRESLEEGGGIFFSEPGAWNPAWYVFLYLFYDWDVEKGMMHCTYFNLKRLLKNAGYSHIKLNGIGLLPTTFFNWSKPLCRFNHWLGSLPILNLFAYRYIVEAYK